MNEAAVRRAIADGCRILAARDLAPGFLGHISLRADASAVWIRCRGPRERGLAFTEPGDVHRVDGASAASTDAVPAGWSPPHELPLHTRILAAREDVACVVHAHPRDTVAADLAGHELVPLVGAYDIPGAALVADGVPVYPSAALIDDAALGDEVAAALGHAKALILRGHGVVTVGSSVAEAVLRAVSLNEIARITLAVAAAGGSPRPIAEEDRARLPDLGAGLNTEIAWRHELARIGPDTEEDG